MPRTKAIPAADAAAAALAEAERDAREAAEQAKATGAAIEDEAQADQVRVLQGGADIIAAAEDRAAQTQAEMEAAAFEADRAAARRAAAATESIPCPPGHVRVKITALGHDKVFTGEDKDGAGNSFPRYERGAKPPFPVSVAKQLIAKGYATDAD